MTDINKDDSAKVELLAETKKLAEDLLKNPEFAEKAIRDRNIIIRGLKADIDHRKVAFKEIAGRYDELADQNATLNLVKEALSGKLDETKLTVAKLEKQLEDKNSELEKINKELTYEKFCNDRVWVIKLEKLAESVPGWKGYLLKVLFARPVSQYIFLGMFCLLFVASFIGWPAIASLLTPIVNLITPILKLFH